MIKFNFEDFNMEEISKEAKISNLLTRNVFRVFGLRQEQNPPILIKYNEHKKDIFSFEPPLRNFFRSNGMLIEFDYFDSESVIAIGLRRDIRRDILLSVALIHTIVYYSEGRVDLKEFKITGLDQFFNPSEAF